MELTRGGHEPPRRSIGEQRPILDHGDTIAQKAHCERSGTRRFGFGTCEGTAAPASA